MKKLIGVEEIVKEIDLRMKDLKTCVQRRTLPSGQELYCNPQLFTNYVRNLFRVVRLLPQLYFNREEERQIYNCEREAIEDMAKESCKKDGDIERVAYYYMNEIENIIQNINSKIKKEI